jgi:DNA-binding XRE family transcriptional regulator
VKHRAPPEKSRRTAFVTRGDRTTHVILPIDEYEALVRAAEVRRLEAKLEDPKRKWIPAEVAALSIAGGWIAQARRKAGLTQKQLADRLGVQQSQVSRIERNPDRTTVRTLTRIAAALGVDVSGVLAPIERRR